MAAASELGGYYAHKPYLCSSLQTSQVIYSQKPSQQRPIFTIGRPESRIALRPFWRVRFDIFELERAYNQLKYALVIQDEFTGHI